MAQTGWTGAAEREARALRHQGRYSWCPVQEEAGLDPLPPQCPLGAPGKMVQGRVQGLWCFLVMEP